MHILSERNASEKATYCVIAYCMIAYCDILEKANYGDSSKASSGQKLGWGKEGIGGTQDLGSNKNILYRTIRNDRYVVVHLCQPTECAAPGVSLPVSPGSER